jgi:hypothetical protein
MGTYWENEVHNIHDTQNQVGYLSLMVSIARENQERCENVVGEHLPMVLSSLFDIDHEYLLQPEGVLDQNIPLPYPSDLSIRPICPKIFEIEQVVRRSQNVLLWLVFHICLESFALPFPASRRPSSRSEAKPAQQIWSDLSQSSRQHSLRMELKHNP